MDNCEHVLSDSAALAEAILVAGPEPTILTTSREPLGLDGETVRGVRSLAVPDADTADAGIAAAPCGPAVRRAGDGGDGRVRAVRRERGGGGGDMCAARRHPPGPGAGRGAVRAMPPEEINRRLGERFRLLSAGRGTHERHRTLQAAVSWSHDLLEPPEQVVFRRLAVFPSSFDLDAAEAVAGGPDTDAIEALMRLVEQSLVEHDATTGRYRLLETLRQYGADRLADAAEVDLARDHHTAFYLALAADCAAPGRFNSVANTCRIDAEMDNLESVADTLAEQDRWDDRLELAGNLLEYLQHFAAPLGYDWYRDTLSGGPALGDQERIERDRRARVLRRPPRGSPTTTAGRVGASPSPTRRDCSTHPGRGPCECSPTSPTTPAARSSPPTRCSRSPRRGRGARRVPGRRAARLRDRRRRRARPERPSSRPRSYDEHGRSTAPSPWRRRSPAPPVPTSPTGSIPTSSGAWRCSRRTLSRRT